MTKKQFKQALEHADWMLSLSNDFKEMPELAKMGMTV